MSFRYLPTAIVSTLVFVIDRCVKYWAYHCLQVHDVIVCKALSFSLTYNTGIAWSMFAGSGKVVESCIIAATLFFLYQIILYARERIFLGKSVIGELLIITGGISNLCDRWLYPGVIDFIKVEGWGYVFPIFNVADMSVCVGMVILLYHHFFKD